MMLESQNKYLNNTDKGVSFHKLPESEMWKKIWLTKIIREGGLPTPENQNNYQNKDFRLSLLTFASNWKLC